VTSIYKKILGNQYSILPKTIQEFHDFGDEKIYKGKCRVKRGNNLLANTLANFLSLPTEKEDMNVSVRLNTNGKKDIWIRNFNGKIFKSIQWDDGKLLYEKVKFTTLVFKIVVSDKMLDMQLQKLYIFGIPLLRFLHPKIIARETEVNGNFHFFIQTTLPIFGLLIEYEGYFEQV
jgi:hypothetical protein